MAALAVPLADLAGDEHEVARHRERDVIRQGRGRLRQLDAEFLEPRVDPSAHAVSLHAVIAKRGAGPVEHLSTAKRAPIEIASSPRSSQ